jgi:hypothetical protein
MKIMGVNRRQFLQNGTLALAGLALASDGEANQSSLQKRIRRLLPSLEAAVKSYSGWDPHRESFHITIVPDKSFYREGCEEPLRRKGIDVTHYVPNTGVERQKRLMERMFSLVDGIYDDTTQTCIIPERDTGSLLRLPKPLFGDPLGELVGLVSKGTEDDALALTVGEELFHHAQFSNFPKFHKRYNQLLRQTVGRYLYVNEPCRESRRAARQLKGLLSLAEGDALLFGQTLRRDYFPNAPEPSLWRQLNGVILLAVSPQLREAYHEKVSQYVHGAKLLTDCCGIDASRRETVNRLYRDPNRAIRIFDP